MKYILHTHLLSFLLLLCTSEIAAQNVRLPYAKEYRSGELSSNLVNKIVQDSYGFIWMATEYGLNKFDGVRFTHYLHNENDTTSLLANNVRTMMLDSKNTLWVGSNKGLQYYLPDEDGFRNIAFPEGEMPHITCITELFTGEIWVATSGWGIFSIDRTHCTAQYLEEVTRQTSDFVGTIYEDRQHYIWLGVNEKGLVRIDPKTNRSVSFRVPKIPHNNITGFVEDNDGKLYVGTSPAVCVFDRGSQTFRYVPVYGHSGISVSNLVLSSKGIVYVSTDGQGLKYIDPHTQTIMPATETQTPLYHRTVRIPALAEDRDQNLWLGCFQKGVWMIPNEPTQFDFLHVLEMNNQMSNNLTSVLKDSEGYIWCSMDGGILKMTSHGEVLEGFNSRRYFTGLYEGSDRTIWATEYYGRGLVVIDRNTGKEHNLHVPFRGYMKTLVEGPDKQLYISTFGTGMVRYNPKTGAVRKYDMKQTDSVRGRLDNDWVNTLLCDSEGLIWMGHYKGISCYDPGKDCFLEIRNKEFLSKQICLSLKESFDGNIWIGTYNGLFCLNKKTDEIRRYTTEDGLSNNVICGLAQDRDGNIWCSTFKGINQLKVKEGRVINYYTGNGLVDKIYNRGVYFQDEAGVVYFGGNNGLTSFSPEEITIPTYNNEVLVTNVYIHNQSINRNSLSGRKHVVCSGILNSKEFRFSYEDNTITFEFSTMDFRDPENICYEYRLKELGSNWNSTLPGISQVTYSYLNPGKYTLEVRASKYGAYTPVKQFTILVSPPWYRSMLAYVLYLCLLAVITLLIVNLIRKRRNEQNNEMKLQFFINISHEIRSPLTLIISPLEKLLKDDFDASTMKVLQGMYRNASRILGLVNQLLDVRKFDKGLLKLQYSETDMVGFIRELFHVFEYQSAKRNIRFVFEHGMEQLPAWIDRNNFDKILMNLLSNAFKYTRDGGEIIVSLNSGVDSESRGVLHYYFEVKITDSGIGLGEDKPEKVFERFYQGTRQDSFATIGSGIGLNLAQKLVHLHAGTITAANRKDMQGSCFTVRIPLGKEHLKKEDFARQVSEARPMLGQELFVQEPDERVANRRTNAKVLIIDDEAEIRNYLEQELGSTYKILTAINGVEGMQLAVSRLPDLIISDVKMPQMDGLGLVKKLKDNHNTSHIPIILLTSRTEHEDRILGLDKGADAYLTKPFNVDELLITARNLISSRKMLKGKFSGAQDQEDKVKPVEFKSSNELLIERIMGVINEEIGNPELNVEMLASRIGLSRVQLHRKMKELVGIATSDFIRNIRLKQASILLREKRMDISQVAYAVGFTSQTYFSTAFKKHFGVSPTEYILQSEEESEPM